jgi:hypothetical protein
MKNTRYKDSFFSLLFSRPDRLGELYGALTGRNTGGAVSISINTLENGLFMNRLNDLSFLVEVEELLIVLVEHQSTVNFNMPLRFLLYLGRLYEKLIEAKALYRRRRISIPRPQFFVLYNGLEPMPDRSVLRLGDAWAALPGETPGENPALDLEVTVFNINQGRNRELLGKSPSLEGYSRFVALVRENAKRMNREEALKEAVRYSISKGILKDFLEEHSGEVENMLIDEWDWDVAQEVWREEAREEGLEQGLEQGMERGMERGLVQGREQGLVQGLEQGRSEGWAA